jgi:hypothetical protein
MTDTATTPTAIDNNDSNDLNGQTFGNDSVEEEEIIVEENGNGKAKKKKKNNNEEEQSQYKSKSKRSYPTYKYSNKGKGPLHEAVLLAGLPIYLTYENSQIKEIPQIEESSRILVPPDPEEYPYEAYEFKDMGEVLSYVERVKKESRDSLYQKAKSIVQKYNDQDEHNLTLLTADIVWSYFQDKFSTTHYDCIIGDNGSGKSTVGDTFVSVGYRPVNMTDPTAANLFRVLGTIEFGQCTIVADEAEKIDQSSEIMGTLKTGYHIQGKVAKINLNNGKQEFYWTYCFKIIISERSPNQGKAKGVLDRMFIFNCFIGQPKYDIKEILNPAGNKRRQELLDELTDFRKLMLMYRLIHFKDPIPDIDIEVDGRDKELCKPTIQLFYNTNVQKEIESALQKFLNLKNQRKENTIEAALFPIIINLVSVCGREVYASKIWEMITSGTVTQGKYDERKPNEYHSSDYGTIYRNTITNIICDKFGAERKRKNDGTVLIFDNEKLLKVGSAYNHRSSIQTKLSEYEDGGGSREGSESSEGCVGSRRNACTAIQVYHATHNGKIEVFSNNEHNIMPNIATNFVNITNKQNYQATLDTKTLNANLQEPSQPSQPSLQGIVQNIYRIRDTDTWACKNCKQRDDKWYMQKHLCSGKR